MLNFNPLSPGINEVGGCADCGKMGGKKNAKKAKGGDGESCSSMEGGKKKVRKAKGGGDISKENCDPLPIEGGKKKVRKAKGGDGESCSSMEGGKKSKNPYIQFVKKNFKKVQQQNPTLKATQVMKKISEMYRAQKK